MSILIPPPTRFVGLHGHTGFSVFDGLGYPSDHIDFVIENGMDAWALTDHGNGSGLAHAHKHAEKVKKAGKKFRQIYGCEFYFVPDLKQWKDDYEQAKIDRAAAKAKAIKEEDVDLGIKIKFSIQDGKLVRTITERKRREPKNKLTDSLIEMSRQNTKGKQNLMVKFIGNKIRS